LTFSLFLSQLRPYQSTQPSLPTLATILHYSIMAFPNLFKYIITGDPGVGKTSLLLQYTQKRFCEDHTSTFAVDLGVRLGAGEVELHIWDTAWQESCNSLVRSYYRKAVAALLVSDITQRDSFTHLGSWLEEAKDKGSSALMVL